jgi:hypothetical protein
MQHTEYKHLSCETCFHRNTDEDGRMQCDLFQRVRTVVIISPAAQTQFIYRMSIDNAFWIYEIALVNFMRRVKVIRTFATRCEYFIRCMNIHFYITWPTKFLRAVYNIHNALWIFVRGMNFFVLRMKCSQSAPNVLIIFTQLMQLFRALSNSQNAFSVFMRRMNCVWNRSYCIRATLGIPEYFSVVANVFIGLRN